MHLSNLTSTIIVERKKARSVKRNCVNYSTSNAIHLLLHVFFPLPAKKTRLMIVDFSFLPILKSYNERHNENRIK